MRVTAGLWLLLLVGGCREEVRTEGVGTVSVALPLAYTEDEAAARALRQQPGATSMAAKVFRRPGGAAFRVALTESVVPLPAPSRQATVGQTLEGVLTDGAKPVGAGMTSTLKERTRTEVGLRFTLESEVGTLRSYTRGRLALTDKGLAQGVVLCQCMSGCEACQQVMSRVTVGEAPGALKLDAPTP